MYGEGAGGKARIIIALKSLFSYSNPPHTSNYTHTHTHTTRHKRTFNVYNGREVSVCVICLVDKAYVDKALDDSLDTPLDDSLDIGIEISRASVW